MRRRGGGDGSASSRAASASSTASSGALASTTTRVPPGSVDDQVRAQARGQRDLLGEVAVLDHPGELDHPPELHLPPLTADVRAPERAGERAGLAAQGLVGAQQLRQLRLEAAAQRVPVPVERAKLRVDAAELLVDRRQQPLGDRRAARGGPGARQQHRGARRGAEQQSDQKPECTHDGRGSRSGADGVQDLLQRPPRALAAGSQRRAVSGRERASATQRSAHPAMYRAHASGTASAITTARHRGTCRSSGTPDPASPRRTPIRRSRTRTAARTRRRAATRGTRSAPGAPTQDLLARAVAVVEHDGPGRARGVPRTEQLPGLPHSGDRAPATEDVRQHVLGDDDVEQSLDGHRGPASDGVRDLLTGGAALGQPTSAGSSLPARRSRPR